MVFAFVGKFACVCRLLEGWIPQAAYVHKSPSRAHQQCEKPLSFLKALIHRNHHDHQDFYLMMLFMHEFMLGFALICPYNVKNCPNDPYYVS